MGAYACLAENGCLCKPFGWYVFSENKHQTTSSVSQRFVFVNAKAIS